MIIKKSLLKDKIFYSKLMYNLIKKLYPINRSLTGIGNRKSLQIIKSLIPLKLNHIKSGTKVFDWTVPLEWNVKNAYFQNFNGKKYAEFSKNNLHLVGYSIPVKKVLNFDELKKKIHLDEKKSNAIPYVTSYYKKNWGFCMSKSQFKKVKGKKFKVLIDTEFKKGEMNYGELLIKGKQKKEILFSTYICHPSMANNELSGPAVCTAICKYINNLKKIKKLNFSYRFVFVPETIGSISYIHKNLKNLKKNVIAGFVIHCAGDERSYSFVQTPDQNTLADDIMMSSFINKKNTFIYKFKDRSSDERQYCSPNVDLPVCSFSRSKAGSQNFPEYHTHLDNLKVVTKKGLLGSFEIFTDIINALEFNPYPKSKIKCEPFMTKRKLYPTLSKKGKLSPKIQKILDIHSYSNGKRSIFKIANALGLDLKECIENLKELKKLNLI